MRARSAAVLGASGGISLVLMSACLLTTSLDGLREEPGAAVDGAGGGGDSDASALTDGPLITADGPIGDGGGNNETSTTPSCASLNPPPLFCDDFDILNEALGARWTDQEKQGTLDFIQDDPASPPRALRATSQTSATSNLHIRLRKQFTSQPARIKTSFDVRVVALPTGVEIEVGLVAVRHFGAYFSFPIAIQSDGSLRMYSQRGYDDGGFFGRTVPTTVKVPMQAWTHFEVLLDMTASPPVLTLRMNQATVIDKYQVDSGLTPGPTELEVGITYVSKPPAPCIADTDNVFFDDQL